MTPREIILALYPDLATDTGLDGVISVASSQVGAAMPNRSTGVAYLAMHLKGITKAPMGSAGGVTSAKAGQVSRTYGQAAGGGLHGSTMWGREFDAWIEANTCGLAPKYPYAGIYY